MPARLLLLCLLFRSSWLTVEGGRQVGAARVLHRQGGPVAVAVSVGVAGGVPMQKSRWPVWTRRECRTFVNAEASHVAQARDCLWAKAVVWHKRCSLTACGRSRSSASGRGSCPTSASACGNAPSQLKRRGPPLCNPGGTVLQGGVLSRITARRMYWRRHRDRIANEFTGGRGLVSLDPVGHVPEGLPVARQDGPDLWEEVAQSVQVAAVFDPVVAVLCRLSRACTRRAYWSESLAIGRNGSSVPCSVIKGL